jgi:2-polyprenyl-3-methyl-5-hydroxy-6-metoxy-1,4-benzoquinol methylase
MEAEMLIKDPYKEWEKFGKRDPYYGVMTYDRFRKHNLTESHLAEFFQSGRDHVEYVLETIRASVQPDFSPSRALDFGCGVGRCTIPLARVCPVVIGVDVSSSVLEEARENATRQRASNTQFVTSDDRLSNVVGNFDLIVSTFVIQHISYKRGEKILKRLIELLTDTGVGAVDFLIARNMSTIARAVGFLRKKVPLVNNLANLLYGRPFSEPLMEKNVYDLNRIVRMLYENGCGNLQLRIFRNGPNLDAIVFFQRKRDRPVPHEQRFGNVA